MCYAEYANALVQTGAADDKYFRGHSEKLPADTFVQMRFELTPVRLTGKNCRESLSFYLTTYDMLEQSRCHVTIRR
jgi:hypothetical protein